MSSVPVILASASQTRAAILRNAGVIIEQKPAIIDEESLRDALWADRVATNDAAVILAESKARHVARIQDDDAIILGADQLLDFDGQWLTKPRDLAIARQQLKQLAGNKHRLISAVVAYRGGDRIWHHVDIADIWMRQYSDGFVDEYLATTGDTICQSVGAYHLEGYGAQLMAKIKGDYFSVLGLPLIPTLRFLRDQHVLRR